jgi:hypothetical protein
LVPNWKGNEMEQLALLDPTWHVPGYVAWCGRFGEIHVDLGTGDAAWALRLARQRPDVGVIGVDTCLDHVRGNPRRRPANLMLLRCDATALPAVLDGRVSRSTVNCPYGRLLMGLLSGDEVVIARLGAALAPGGGIELRVNASALVGTGHSLATAEGSLMDVCRRVECSSLRHRRLGAVELRRFPSTWAKRIGYGREAVAIEIAGRRRTHDAHGAMLP